MVIAPGLVTFGLDSALVVEQHGVSLPGAARPATLRRVNGRPTLPGQPWVDLRTDELLPYLRRALLVESLDKAARYLWLVRDSSHPPSAVSPPDMVQAGSPTETHISSLHHQYARGREIVITEDPGLHLVWYHDKIFIKPLPQYLLCTAFWDYIRTADEDIWRAAAGFMRTYCYLIQYESDFRKASHAEMGLIPSINGAATTFESFVRFISQFKDLDNSEVAKRYSYGMLRLSRLNYLAFFTMGTLTYFHIHSQWNDYLGVVIAPAITIFAIVSTLLNSMQVGLAVEDFDANTHQALPPFAIICRVVSLGTILMVTVFVVLLVLFFVAMVVKEMAFGRSMLRAKQKQKTKGYHAVVGV